MIWLKGFLFVGVVVLGYEMSSPVAIFTWKCDRAKYCWGKFKKLSNLCTRRVRSEGWFRCRSNKNRSGVILLSQSNFSLVIYPKIPARLNFA